MTETRPAMKMPELLVFARIFAIGLVGAEVLRLTFYGGARFALLLADIGWQTRAIGLATVIVICATYAFARRGVEAAARFVSSARLDLLSALLLGAWSNTLIAPWLSKLHTVAINADPLWAPTLLGALLLLMASSLVRTYWPRTTMPPQMYFLGDDDIKDSDEDVLGVGTQAKNFAETVLASGSHSGLVFGIDGPWGVGKTSFVNLAAKHWEAAKDQVIVLRFEPLRYAADPDLADKLIRDLSAAIQKQLYVPEFQPAASRYSRMLKGKADLSFFGLKLSLEPTSETIDELLGDIDDVLKRVRRRVIIVVDDLDRLEAKAVNNVLFAARRTFQLSQAAYILCYHTESLVGARDEGERAREFLEKFVNVKLSLFVDPLTLQGFLRHGWQDEKARFPLIPADTMAKVESLLSELSEMLGDTTAANYMPLIGDLRKLKRFVNAALLMQIEKTDLGRTDFNKRDLVHLILLHLKYPGTFRQIYAEEAEGRSGKFSMRRTHSSGASKFENSEEFVAFMKDNKGADRFLLEQLFDASTLGIGDSGSIDEPTLSSRACFNAEPHRNLEKYLKLIVRFDAPEPRETFRLYQDAVDRVVRKTDSVSSVLSESEFDLRRGELAHDQFWRVLVSQSYDFTHDVAKEAINTLVEFLPRYSTADAGPRALRARSIYSLIRLLDRAGWGRTEGPRRPNTAENIVEIARRIYGEGEHSGKGLIERLASDDRGVLGWNDLMLFRLQCSADRGGQVFNVHGALIVHDDMNAPTTGLTSALAQNGMRTLSQQVFSRFKQTFIEKKLNFISEVNKTADADFFGRAEAYLKAEAAKLESGGEQLANQLLAARSFTKNFVLYQLANAGAPKGSGVGCGFYDEVGTADSGGIAAVMNNYVFEICFNPDVTEDNMFLFADYCLCNLTSGFFSEGNEAGYIPTEQGLASGLDPAQMQKYWREHGPKFKVRGFQEMNRNVVTPNYIATYREDLPKVFIVLDNMHTRPPSAFERA